MYGIFCISTRALRVRVSFSMAMAPYRRANLMAFSFIQFSSTSCISVLDATFFTSQRPYFPVIVAEPKIFPSRAFLKDDNGVLTPKSSFSTLRA